MALRSRLFLLLSSIALLVTTAQAAEQPNIILIMVDDMGYSDLGYMGGEIDTPNLNTLAEVGVKFSQFYNSGRCCPTRATLMTGLHPHQAGIGWMTEPPNSDRGKTEPPAYQGHLNESCLTIGEALKPAGYATFVSGKWHLGFSDLSDWPLQRGFEKYYGCIAGATRFFSPIHPRGMFLGNDPVPNTSTTDEAFYTTDAFTDHAIRFLKEEEAGQDRPTFLYLAYTAPHWPLQAFEDDIAKYRGKYTQGWDQLRKSRFARQKELGLFSPNTQLSPRTPNIPDWESLSEDKRDEMDLKMVVYAAMIDRIDQNIGKLVTYLKESNQYDNTLILFLSDNGACQEGGMLGRGNFHDIEKRNLEHANSYGEAWANAGNTPYRLYKHFTHEGGSATPFFLHWPKGIRGRKKDWYREPAQLIDILPTLLDVAGGQYPEVRKGKPLHQLDGISLRPAFTHQPLNRQSPIFIEHETNASIRDGQWKLVGKKVSIFGGTNRQNWELYNLHKDPTETQNLASQKPKIAKKLADQWEAWAKDAGVYPRGKKSPSSAVGKKKKGQNRK